MTARVHILFTQGNVGWGGEVGPYISEAAHEGYSTFVNPGDQNTLTFTAPIPLSVLAELEDSRNNRDAILQMSVAYLAVERTTEGGMGERFLAAEFADPRSGGSRLLFYPVARSQWEGLLKTFELSEELRAPRRIFHEIVASAKRAREEAETYARDAKAASSLTAVTTLSQAYDEEAKDLNRTAVSWLVSAAFIALVAAGLMVFYVYESFQVDFTPSQTVLRVFVLAAVALGLCLRYYNNYKHLQLLNRHRVNLGRTFEALKAAQPSDQARNLLAAVTAEEMVHFGRSTPQGKDTAETQVSIVAELLKSFIEKQKG